MPQPRKRRKTKTRQRLFLLLFVVAGVILFFAYQRNSLASQVVAYSDLPGTVGINTEPWAENDYTFRQKLNIDSNTRAMVRYEFNHADLVDAKQSNQDGSDLLVVSQNGNDFQTIPVSITGENTTKATIKFDTSKSPTAQFYLYYGNRKPLSENTPSKGDINNSSSTSLVSAGELEKPFVSITSDKYWCLRYKTGADLSLNISLSDNVWSDSNESYFVIGNKKELNSFDLKNAKSEGQTIKLGNIDTGDQQVFIVVKHDGQLYRSPAIHIMVSEPMFVAWTIDWEGKNVTDLVLAAINKIATNYNIPLTEFFNPRIYIDNTIQPYRRQQITNWLKARLTINHDEMAMHMHMYYDMVKASGVDPRYDPHWGSGADGYDVLASAYTSEEMSKIIKWGLQEFDDQGLPKPQGFRAGGWFAGLDTLKALNDFGFKYDASGRESYKFGANETKGPWNLTHTTQPYHPSTVDQNAATPGPVFNLWEMPNNGNDSYWFSADDLISRFYANYTAGSYLSDQKIVTYLSHPDWFDTDQPKLTKLFLEIDKYNFAKDKGPVVYTTMSNALKEWE